MTDGFKSGALLGHLYELRDGVCVRLRLARSSDSAALRALLEHQGIDPGELELARLVHFDPRRRYVVCATGLVERSERLLGVGAISLEGASEPELLVVGDEQPEELAELLRRALVAVAWRRRAA